MKPHSFFTSERMSWSPTQRKECTVTSRIARATFESTLRHMNVGPRNMRSLSQLTPPASPAGKIELGYRNKSPMSPVRSMPHTSSNNIETDSDNLEIPPDFLDISDIECGTIDYAERVEVYHFSAKDIHLFENVKAP